MTFNEARKALNFKPSTYGVTKVTVHKNKSDEVYTCTPMITVDRSYLYEVEFRVIKKEDINDGRN